MFWLIRQVLKLVLLAVLVVAGFFAWALLWPRPHDVTRARCPPDRPDCISVSGRVLYHTAFGPGRHAHLVLVSSSSLTLPGIATGEFPSQLTRAPGGLGFGDWVSIDGQRKKGSHHETDIHILGISTATAKIRCGTLSGRRVCTNPDDFPNRIAGGSP